MGERRRRRSGRDRDEAAVREVLARLDAIARRVLERELRGQRPSRPLGRITLDVDVALDGRPDDDDRVAATLRHLGDRVRAVSDGVVPLRPGRIYCFRSGSSREPHCVPATPREVFIGYDPTGRPRFTDFADLALARGDARIDDLYQDPPRPFAIYASGHELRMDQLDVFGGRSDAFRIIAQLAFGYVPARGRVGVDGDAFSLTIQAVETRDTRDAARFDLNIVGGPSDRSLEAWLAEALDGAVATAVRAARRRVRDVARGRRAGTDAEAAIEPILRDLARALERFYRQRGRRTRHSRDRRQQRDRPTQQALVDAERADADHVFRDDEKRTWVVVGPRGRTHVFSDDGRHVTSVSYTREAIERKCRQKRWRSVDADRWADALARLRG